MARDFLERERLPASADRRSRRHARERSDRQVGLRALRSSGKTGKCRRHDDLSIRPEP
jgi:hypothetical protein